MLKAPLNTLAVYKGITQQESEKRNSPQKQRNPTNPQQPKNHKRKPESRNPQRALTATLKKPNQTHNNQRPRTQNPHRIDSST
jgi:hypothetical protein